MELASGPPFRGSAFRETLPRRPCRTPTCPCRRATRRSRATAPVLGAGEQPIEHLAGVMTRTWGSGLDPPEANEAAPARIASSEGRGPDVLRVDRRDRVGRCRLQ